MSFNVVTLNTAIMENNTTKTHNLILVDRQLKMRQIAERVGISNSCVGHIQHETLGMRKLSVRCVPRMLIPDKKCNREITWDQCLTLFKGNPKEFCIFLWWLAKYGSTGSYQRIKNNQNYGCHPTNELRTGEDCPISRKGDRIHKVWSTLTTWR